MRQPAFLFDLNGTLIDDMSYHHEVWYEILVNDLGAKLSWEEVKHQMYGRNDELLTRVFGPEKFSRQEIEKISMGKEVRYQSKYRNNIALLPGLASFLRRSYERKIKMAIGSAAIPFNIDFVLDALNIRHYFETIVSADDVTSSKPDPQTYLLAASQIGVKPADCIVFEDAPKGVESAQKAGMRAVVLTTTHPESDFKQYTNVLLFSKDYEFLDPDNILV